MFYLVLEQNTLRNPPILEDDDDGFCSFENLPVLVVLQRTILQSDVAEVNQTLHLFPVQVPTNLDTHWT